MTPRRQPRRAVAVALLVVGAPLGAALAFGQAPAEPPPTDRTPVRVVAEQVTTARDIVPFGAARRGAGAIVWATGSTRPPIQPTDPPAPDPGAGPPDPSVTTPPLPTSPALPDTGERLLLVGLTGSAGEPTQWRRTEPPADRDGNELAATRWRPAGGSAPLAAGSATPDGAAALLTEIGPSGAGRPAILALDGDGRFRELKPPDEAVHPAARPLFDPSAPSAPRPFAVVDATPRSGGAPAPTDPLTGVLLASPGDDGVLVWDGSAWTKEPFLTSSGASAGAVDPVALAATPAGDAVALVAGDPASPARITLYRRAADHSGWRPVALTGAPLLEGPLPAGVAAVRTTGATGAPLTVADGHWWVDLLVTRTDGRSVSATVHLVPGRRPAGPTTPVGTAPTSPAGPSSPTTATSPSTPTTPAPAESTPATDPSTPADPQQARETGGWCSEPALPAATGCNHDLGAAFAASSVGYRSQAFPGSGFGGRVITHPAEPDAAGTAAATSPAADTSSGGHLSLIGDQFALRSGVGPTGSQAAAFLTADTGWLGGERAVGHVVPADSATRAAIDDANGDYTQAAIAIATSPPGTDAADAGALLLTLGGDIKRSQGPGGVFTYTGSGLSSSQDEITSRRRRYPRAIAWPRPGIAVVAGLGGLLRVGNPPAIQSNFPTGPGSGPDTTTDVASGAGLDLTALGFTRDGPLDGWAIGLAGALVRCSDGVWSRAQLPPALSDADLRQIAYAGGTAVVASSAGLLRETSGSTGTFTVDTGLAALLRADGRPVGVSTVAALDDGTIVVDARYVQQPGDPWTRLSSPAEGNVVATAIARDAPAAGEARGALKIVAAVDDQPVPRTAIAAFDASGNTGAPEDGNGAPSKDPAPTTPQQLVPLAVASRLVEWTGNGWVDRVRTPIEVQLRRDLPVPMDPVQALTLDDSGRGWAVGGTGYPERQDIGTFPRALIAPLSTDLAENPAATTPLTPPPAPPAAGPSAIVRVMIGGHPACLDTCADRGDQRLAPDENLTQALQAAGRLRAGNAFAPPVRAFVVGGGRSATDSTTGLTAAGARRYASLLQSVSGAPPVLPAIGTGDTVRDGRANFARFVAGPLTAAADRTPADSGLVRVTSPTAAGGAVATTPDGDPTTVAYAYDVRGDGSATARMIVIDNAGGALRGGLDGPQAQWLRAALADASDRELPAVVVGAAAFDERPGTARDFAEEAALLAEGGATAYVSTDAEDNPNEAQLGARARQFVLRTPAGPLQTYRAAGLGHALPYPRVLEAFNAQGSGDNGDFIDVESELFFGATTVVLDIDTDLSHSAGEGKPFAVNAKTVPLFRRFAAQPPVAVQTGEASFAGASTKVDYDNGRMWIAKDTQPSQAPGVPEEQARADIGLGDGTAAPLGCSFNGRSDACKTAIETDTQFVSDDPSIAVFVRARASRSNGPPDIVLDAAGNPIVDPSSNVLCPLKAGTTSFTVYSSGVGTRVPLTVVGPVAGYPGSAPRSGSPRAPCGFFYGATRGGERPATPDKPKPGLPAPAPAPTPPAKQPVAQPRPLPVPPQASLVTPASPLFISAAPAGATPPLAPNPKPITAPPTPTPPTGVSTQQVPVQSWSQVVSPAAQAQLLAVHQEERRAEVAREGSDHHATIYRPAPRDDLTTALAGGALAILLALGGYTAGRRRALARAARARGWLR